VVHALGRDVDEAVGQLKSLRVAHLEGRCVVQLAGLLGNRLGDLRAAMAGVDAPQARRAIEDLAAIGGGVMHVLRADEHPRVLLELAVCGERHPESTQIIGGCVEPV
jgi:hypothetical protein